MPDPVSCVRARLLVAPDDYHDGDTFQFLLDVCQTGYKFGAQSVSVRMRDYSCPERNTTEGKLATTAAFQVLLDAGRITVDLKGHAPRSMGRLVGWIWADDKSLGAELVRMGHARPGAFEG